MKKLLAISLIGLIATGCPNNNNGTDMGNMDAGTDTNVADTRTDTRRDTNTPETVAEDTSTEDTVTTDTAVADAADTILMDATDTADTTVITGNAFEALFVRQTALSTELCTCDMGTAMTVAACVEAEVGTTSNPSYVCGLSSYNMGGIPTVDAEIRCRAAAFEDATNCIRAAACSESGIQTCLTTGQAALDACPTALTEEQRTNTGRINACLVGPAGVCPAPGEPSSMVGAMVFSGNTAMQGNDLTPDNITPPVGDAGVDAGDAGEDAGDAGPAPVLCSGTTTQPGGTGADVVHSWTAPSTGLFDIRINADFDTVLYVRSSCTDTMNAVCNDDISDENFASQIRLSAVAGTTYFIVVDGFRPASFGEYTVDISPIICPDVTTAPASPTGMAVFTGTTLGAGNQFAGSCGGNTGEDVSFAWTAPSTGRFVIDTQGAMTDAGPRTDTVLYVLESCMVSTSLVCNDDGDELTGNASQVTLDAVMGTTYVIVVDAFAESSAGPFVVNINPELN